MYFVHGWQLFGLLFSLVTCCSLLADRHAALASGPSLSHLTTRTPRSVAPQNKLVCTADRVFATLSTILRRVRGGAGPEPVQTLTPHRLHSPGRILLYPGLACVQVKLLVVVLLAGSLRVLHWSRESPDMGHFRWRHTLWHVCSAAALTWLARVDGLGLHQTPLFDVTAEASRVLVYASQAASV